MSLAGGGRLHMLHVVIDVDEKTMDAKRTVPPQVDAAGH
jgi:hypothetical protein